MSKNGRKHQQPDALRGLLYQLLETEMGGVQVYRTALQCASRSDLIAEWSKYLSETEHHVVIARSVLEAAGLDPDLEIAARVICRHDAEGLVELMQEALVTLTSDSAQLVAAECLVKAETKDHMNWSLLKAYAKDLEGDLGDALRAACAEIEPQEDHHLYHTAGWARELWRAALDLDPVLPPPEDQEDVGSAMEAAQAKADAHPDH